jgi:hypothetical protein
MQWREGSYDGRCHGYPCAIAPTINTTKLVATAIATFVSTDKLINPPFVMVATLMTPLSTFRFLDRFEFQFVDGCQNEKIEVKRIFNAL